MKKRKLENMEAYERKHNNKYKNISDSEQSETDTSISEEIKINKPLLKIIADILFSIILKEKKTKSKRNKKSPFYHEHIPKISIFDYLLRIQKYSEIENSTLIFALIYLDRILVKKEIKLSKYNIHRLLFTSILISMKINEDCINKNLYYSKIAGVPVKELITLENEFLKIIDFELFVSDEIYKKYYHSLNANNIIGIN